jgi:Fic family protein
MPTQRQREFLMREGFLSKGARGFWILKKPEESLEDVFPLLYWQFVEKALSRFNHWSVRGQSALLVLSGHQDAQEQLLVRTENKSNWKLTLPLGFNISLSYDADFDKRLVRTMNVADTSVPVDVPERVLVDVARFPATSGTRNFVAGTDFEPKMIEAIYATKPKPVLFKRLIHIAEEAGRPDLAGVLARTIETYTNYRVVKRATAGESEHMQTTKPDSPPWVLRQDDLIKEFEQVLRKHVARKIGSQKKRPLRALLRQADEHKQYDTYHSTTLEGYRITPEEVEALLSGVVPEASKGSEGRYVEEVENRMAIVGYSKAFDFILGRVENDYGRPVADEQLIKDTYYHIFKPSADAGIIDYLSLTMYRNVSAFIRGTSYVPPSPEKVPQLMASLVTALHQVENPVVEAILAHYWFVTIHPYIDGNGRTGRLLMNYILVSSGFPWVTIRVDQRARYFQTLKQGQVAGDILAFGEFIVEMVKAAG